MMSTKGNGKTYKYTNKVSHRLSCLGHKLDILFCYGFHLHNAEFPGNREQTDVEFFNTTSSKEAVTKGAKISSRYIR